MTGVRAERGSDAAEAIGTAFELRVADPTAALSGLLAWSARRGVELRGLEVVPGTLEDIFLQLTGTALRD